MTSTTFSLAQAVAITVIAIGVWLALCAAIVRVVGHRSAGPPVRGEENVVAAWLRNDDLLYGDFTYDRATRLWSVHVYDPAAFRLVAVCAGGPVERYGDALDAAKAYMDERSWENRAEYI